MELRQLLDILWRRRRLCIGLVLGAFLSIWLTSLLVVPRYVATSKILLVKSPSASALLNTLGLRAATLTDTVSDAEVANYKQVALSVPVMQAVAKELNPQRLRARSLLPRMIPGATWLLPRIGLESLLNATKPMQWDELTDKSALQFFIPRPYVDVEEDADADVYSVTVESTDMEESVRLANTWARVFMDRDVELQREEFYRFGDSIEARIPLAKAEYERTLKELQAFREKNTSISLDEEVIRLIGQVSTVATDRDEASVEAERYRAMLAEAQRHLANAPRYTKSQEQLERNPVVDSVKLTLRDLYMELADSRSLYTDQHPEVKDIHARIKQARELIQEEVGKVFSSEVISQDPLYTELAQTAAARAADLAGAEMQQQAYDQVLAKLRTQLHALPAQQSAYALLTLAASRAENYYQTLTDIRYQVETARGLAVSNLRLVESATMPPDISDYKKPDLILYTAIAIFFAGFLGLTGTFLREYLDPTVLHPGEAERAASAPCLAVLPPAPALPATPVGVAGFRGLAPGHPWREGLAKVAAALESGLAETDRRRIALLPMHDTPAAALAVAQLGQLCGEERHSVLLMELRLHAPQLQSLFGVSRAPGLQEVLAGSAAMASCVQALPLEHASLLTAGGTDRAPGGALSRRALQPIVAEAARQFARIVCLLPPVTVTADGMRVVELADDVILLASQGVTSREALARTAQEVTQAGGTVRGVILLRHPRHAPFTWPLRRSAG